MTGPRAADGGEPLGFGRRLGYGIGDFGFNLFFTTAGLFLLFYYTDVLGLPPAIAGWVFAGALIWDAVFDPFIGFVASRTRTRWGRYRPYILWGALPLAGAWVLMFLPTGLSGSLLILFVIFSHVLFRSLYAVVNMPYLALSAAMTSDSGERGTLAGIRMVAAASCGMVAALSTLKLVHAFGGGQQGFFWAALLYGIVATAIFFLVVAATREATIPHDAPRVGSRDMLRMLRGNRAFWIVASAMLLGAIGNTFFQKTLPYYLKYVMHREDMIGTALAVVTGSMMLSIPLWTWVARRKSKRTAWLAGACVGIVGYMALWLSPPAPLALIIILAPIGAGAGAAHFGFWSMMPDTVEYGEWRSGVRAEGAIFGLVAFIQKASLGLAAAGLGEILASIGYRANMIQAPETLRAMRFVLTVLPMIACVGAAAIIALYPIDQRAHTIMLRAIRRKR